jgi:hypothetical protein
MYNHRRMKQYTIIRACPTNEAQEELKGTNCLKSKQRLPGLSPIRWFSESQGGRLDHMSGSPRQLNGGHQARVHSDQMVLMIARQGGQTR